MATTIGEQFQLQRGFDITKKDQRKGTVPVVSSGGISSYHDTPMANGPGVVIGRKGSLGTVHFIDGSYWPHDTTLWVKDFRGNLPRYVYYFLRGLDVRAFDSGTANPSLNRNRIHPIQVSWPSAALQQELSSNLDDLKSSVGILEELCKRKKFSLLTLKTSILGKAFTGQLGALGSEMQQAAE